MVNFSAQLNRHVQAIPATNQPAGPGRDMTFAEKRKLSSQLSRMMLMPEQLQSVLDIVAEDPRVSAAPAGDVEVEIDQLRSDTLWKLSELIYRPAVKPLAQTTLPKPPPPARATPPPAAEPKPTLPAVAEKQPPAPETTASVVLSGAGSDSDGEHSPKDVKGSTMDDPRQGPSPFVRDGRNVVDESATAPKEQSLFVKDKAAARKDVNINSADWSSLTTADDKEAPGPSEGEKAEGGDDVWKSFQSIA